MSMLVCEAAAIVLIPAEAPIRAGIDSQRHRLIARLRHILPDRSHRYNRSRSHVEGNRRKIQFASDFDAFSASGALICPEIPPLPKRKIYLSLSRCPLEH